MNQNASAILDTLPNFFANTLPSKTESKYVFFQAFAEDTIATPLYGNHTEAQ